MTRQEVIVELIMMMMMITGVAIVTMFQATVTMFSGHIIVAIFAEANSPLLGLRFPSEMQFGKMRNLVIFGTTNPLLEYKKSTSGT